MFRRFVLFILIVFIAQSICAQERRIAMADFVVHSHKPKYSYIGKGISEMIALELAKSPEVTLVEREKRVSLLEEMEIALSELSENTEAQVQVGKMLTAGYLVFGEIVDMEETLLVSLRMTNVESAKVVWKDQVNEKPGNYEYIAGYLSSSILRYLNARITESTAKKIEEKREKNEEAVVAFSRAIDAYDQNEKEKAKEELQIAKQIDPEYEAAQIYLNKLTLNQSKFKTITEQYMPNHNPAYLGIIQFDKIYLTAIPYTLISSEYSKLSKYPDREFREGDSRGNIGAQFPLGKSVGLDVTVFTYHHNSAVQKVSEPDEHSDFSCGTGIGGILSFGWAPSEIFSIGISVSLYGQARSQIVLDTGGGSLHLDQNFFVQAFSCGFLLRNRSSTLIFDTYGGYSLEENLYFNPDIFPNYENDLESYKAPLFIENTITLSLNQRRTFLIFKQSNDIYLDIGRYYGRLLPAFEHWFTEWGAVRAGVEGSLIKLENDISLGIGGTAGISFRIPKKGWDFDLNFTFRRRPARVLQGEFKYEFIPFIGVSKSNSFVSR